MRRRPAACHAERDMHALGLCESCYKRHWAGLPVPVDPSLLRRNVWHTKGQMGVMRLGEIFPQAITDAEQRRFIVDPDLPVAGQLPDRCPHCHALWTLVVDGRLAHCIGARAGCGATYALCSPPPMVTT